MRKLILLVLLLCAHATFGQGVAVSINNGLTRPALCQPRSINAYIHRTGAATADAFSVCTAANTWTDLATVAGTVPATRTISTTAPLGGGGDLSADRTLTCTTCATSSNNLSFFSSTTSAQLLALLSDETGTNKAVFSDSPTIVTPTIGSFTNATHNHQNAAGGGTLVDAAITFTAPALGAPTATTVQTSGNVGIGNTPSGTTGVLLSGTGTGNFSTIFQVTNADAADTGSAAQIKALADTANFIMSAHGTARTTSRFGSAIGGWNELLASAGSGLKLGTLSTVPLILGTNSTAAITVDSSQNTALTPQALTAGTMTGTYEAVLNDTTTCRSWTNAQVTALPTTAGDIAWGTLPAKTKVIDAAIIITGAAVGPATVSVSLGRTSATYIDYIVASDAKAAANTVYGDASAERGTNLTGYDLPSYTGTTVVNAHFISTGANLSTVTSSTGLVCITTRKLP